MMDKDKVVKVHEAIKALEFCADETPIDSCFGKCPYAISEDEFHCNEMKRDVLDLLKEQEERIKDLEGFIMLECGKNYC